MRDKLPSLEKAGAQLLAVDPHESWCAKSLLKESGLATDDLHYPMLTDPAQIVSATYGVAFQMRIHTEWCNRPATFVIDRDGVIRYAKRGTSYNDRPKPQDILEELAKLNPGK